ncbi:MAG TPA: aminotransferase class V-fold PLP-dependent enzyme [Holophagaceae bacterium]|nr:aminotransferase class V-fold PLP-dependent enzyme [Holophagaceae bacterium]
MTAPLNPALFHFDPQVTWVMHCAEGPVPRAAMRAVRAFMFKELQPWKSDFRADFIGLPAAVRREGARILGAEAEDLSLVANTSDGLQRVAMGFPWQAGDEVLVPLGEFPSNAWPWKAQGQRGVSFREVPLWEGHRAGAEAWASAPPTAEADPEARLLAALGPSTKVLTLSWVRFQDGLKLDLPKLAAGCAERGVALVVDAIQGLGTSVVPSLAGISALASSGHKGLLAPQGLGLLWTEPAFRASLVPSGSWLSVEGATDFARPNTDLDRAWLANGERLEAGVPNLLGCAALVESLKAITHAGVASIEAHVRKLQHRLLSRLEGSAWDAEAARLRGLLEADRLGSILAFHHRGLSPETLQAALHKGMRQGVYASVREGYLRVALHGFHTEADVDRVAAWMRNG